MIEQALLTTKNDGGFDCVARSSGFDEAWLPAAEQLCAGFGVPPAAATCPASLFVQPLDRGHVAIVQVAANSGPLVFRLLVLPTALYADLHGDPFRVADAFPPSWNARGDLPTLDWTAGAPPRRTVADVQQTLDVPYSATLLGGVQALLDGGRVVFERMAPDERIVRALWALLPISNRCELWPATFAFGNALGFDVVVVPRADGPDYANYVTEVRAGDYPEGRYELALQAAAESDDQKELDKLFSRRSRGQTMRLGLILLALFILLPLTNLICGAPQATPTTAATKEREPKKEVKP